jgi:hypothetical protein
MAAEASMRFVPDRINCVLLGTTKYWASTGALANSTVIATGGGLLLTS